MKKVQQGFTLIELMIVVAIIGILAAIAIPQYQNYVTRAKWSDNITSMEAVKVAIAECLQNNNGTIASCDTATEIGIGTLPTPKYGTQLSISSTAAISTTGTAAVGSCVVTATPTVAETQVTWTYDNGSVAGCSKSKTGVGT